MYEHVLCTVKPVCNEHARNQVVMVSVDRWSLYRGALVQLKWTLSQPTVVSKRQVISICEWSLRQVLLYMGI